jgi:hypothetical protein
MKLVSQAKSHFLAVLFDELFRFIYFNDWDMIIKIIKTGISIPRLAAACLAVVSLGSVLNSTSAFADSSTRKSQVMPHLVKKDGRYALFVDGAPYLILGAQVNNSSAWPAMLPKVWPAMEALHVNTVEIPVYWEQMQPAPGRFDFSIVDTLLAQARARHLRLVLLWFGTWKNGSAHYLPEWMKLQPAKYPNITGADGRPVDSPSPHAPDTLAADIRAFTALMRHLKAADAQHTVLMVQVENEPGTWGGVRDFSPAAQRLFNAPVPTRLLLALQKTAAPGATWPDVFGDDADEFFHAWSVASYIGKVAAAGKAVNPLPLYVNAALRDPLAPVHHPPQYESGGATDNVLGIWKAAAPAVDVLAPDIYLNDSARIRRVMALYHRPDNALLVPETSGQAPNARYFYVAVGDGAIGYAPFGLDYTRYDTVPSVPPDNIAAFALNYATFGPMDREIARLNFEGKLQADAEETGQPPQTFTFGNWQATVSYGGGRRGGPPLPTPSVPPALLGRVLIGQLNPDQFLVTGAFCHVSFLPIGPAAGRAWQYLRVEEGQYKNGVFHPLRLWNGDQTDYGLNFSSVPQVLRVSLYTR